jgi:hypothetical protein
MVREGDGIHLEFLGALYKIVYLGEAIEKGIMGMRM